MANSLALSLTHATFRDMMRDEVTSQTVPILLDGQTYYSAAELARDRGIARQTLWRWRHDGSVPVGRRYRGRSILFNAGEVAAIKAYANRLEPAVLPHGKSS